MLKSLLEANCEHNLSTSCDILHVYSAVDHVMNAEECRYVEFAYFQLGLKPIFLRFAHTIQYFKYFYSVISNSLLSQTNFASLDNKL
jgi:non-ribosomal peptide synthetase component E (peptide arylation enzyme)